MTRAISDSHPLHRLFRGLTENTFLSELGIGDPHLVGYIADMLARFVATAEIWRIRDAEGRRVNRVTSMLAEAETSCDDQHRCVCHQHVGDFTLFWTGVYPEAVNRLKASDSPDQLVDFAEQGKRSYYLASQLTSEQPAVFRRLSDQFELCAFGLSRVRHGWESSDNEWPEGPRRLIVA